VLETPALEQLRVIEAAVLRHAAPLPLQGEVRPAWRGMGFRLGGLHLVSAMGEVGEILSMPKAAPLPGVKPWVLGIANLRGRLIPVIDLHEFLGMVPAAPRAQWRVLVVARHGLLAGLLVEQSLGIQQFSSEAREEVATGAMGALAPFVRGAFRPGDRTYYEVELTSILENERFLDVAKKTC
jgi:twitching motility protein PilI